MLSRLFDRWVRLLWPLSGAVASGCGRRWVWRSTSLPASTLFRAAVPTGWSRLVSGMCCSLLSSLGGSWLSIPARLWLLALPLVTPWLIWLSCIRWLFVPSLPAALVALSPGGLPPVKRLITEVTHLRSVINGPTTVRTSTHAAPLATTNNKCW